MLPLASGGITYYVECSLYERVNVLGDPTKGANISSSRRCPSHTPRPLQSPHVQICVSQNTLRSSLTRFNKGPGDEARAPEFHVQDAFPCDELA